MNTDNMAVSGETIDYGPCAFMDTYEPATVFSSIDTRGRYAYENQPEIAAWNLARFAETLLPFLHDGESEAVRLGNKEIANFRNLYHNYWLAGMKAKLGLYNDEAGDMLLINNLLELMRQFQADYTNTFRSLTLNEADDTEFFAGSDFARWNEQWKARLCRQEKSKDEIRLLMKKYNPAVIPRNHRVEEALHAAENGDYSVMNKLLLILKNPYEYTSEQIDEYSKLPVNTSCGYKTFCGT
jgi:uncharacterized protein YdiU (UPF0061 family)